MTYQETVDYLYSQLPAFQKLGNKALKPRLTNIRALCAMLGNPQDDFRSIHIAGTNGKGSSSHLLTSILMEAGYKVGLYTSPHLKDYRERFRINGSLVPENCIIDFVRDYGKEFSILKPSFFEVSVALAFKVFSDAKVDVAVIEVGLGGKWDSTNIISKIDLALISNIGFDHTDILGKTLDKIAEQKAGIIKEGIPVVVSEVIPETRPIFEEIAAEKGAVLSFAQEEWQMGAVDASIDRLRLTLRRNDRHWDLHSELVGKYQISNIRGVVEAVRRLNEGPYRISDEAVVAGVGKVIQNTGLQGRWQILGRDPLVICDTGHNDHAFQITFERIAKEPYKQLHFVLGFVKDKDISKIAGYIPAGAKLYLSAFASFRARQVEDLKNLTWGETNEISIYENVNLAMAAARANAGAEDIIFIGGSTYLIAEIEEL